MRAGLPNGAVPGHSQLLLPFFPDRIGLQSFLTAVLLIESFHAGLRTKVKHRRRVLFRKLQKPASDAPAPVLRKDEQLRDRTEKIAVCKDTQASDKRFAVTGSDVYRFRQRSLCFCRIIITRPDFVHKGNKDRRIRADSFRRPENIPEPVMYASENEASRERQHHKADDRSGKCGLPDPTILPGKCYLPGLTVFSGKSILS